MKHRHHSNEHEKEKIERKQVKEFLREAEIPFHSLESNKDDPPDLILVTTEQKRIGIEHTRIFRPDEDKNIAWDEPSKRWEQAISSEDVVPIIEAKNKRLLELKWNETYDETWLVLVVVGEQQEDFRSYKPSDFQLQTNWKFDKIFIYGMFAGNWETIK